MTGPRRTHEGHQPRSTDELLYPRPGRLPNILPHPDSQAMYEIENELFREDGQEDGEN